MLSTFRASSESYAGSDPPPCVDVVPPRIIRALAELDDVDQATEAVAFVRIVDGFAIRRAASTGFVNPAAFH